MRAATNTNINYAASIDAQIDNVEMTLVTSNINRSGSIIIITCSIYI